MNSSICIHNMHFVTGQYMQHAGIIISHSKLFINNIEFGSKLEVYVVHKNVIVSRSTIVSTLTYQSPRYFQFSEYLSHVQQ